jgi:exonuclease SbcC
MRLGRLQGENFRSFESFDLDLNTRGLIAVVGENGAGKSTIFAAVEWALYGNQPGRGATAVRRDGASDGDYCWVELEFESGGRLYSVRRDDKGNAKLIDIATGGSRADTIRGVNQEVAVLLGLDREMFCGTFYARQNEIQALDSPQEAKRRDQLERLLGIDRLRRAEAFATAAAKEQKAVVAAIGETLPDVEMLAGEVERATQAAREGNPAVSEAQSNLNALIETRQTARARLESLRAQAEKAHERTLEAQRARAAADREEVIRGGFAERVRAAQTATAELAELQPVATRLESLSASEREMLLQRDNHEQAAAWRKRLDDAMTKAASVTDQLAAFPSALSDAASQELVTAVANSEKLLDTLRATVVRLAAELRAADDHAQQLEASLLVARRAAELDGELATLAEASEQAEGLTRSLQDASTRRAGLATQLRHDQEHRDSIIADGTHAACPRCKRSYGEDWEQILRLFEGDISIAGAEIAELDAQMVELGKQAKAARARADTAHQLAGERSTIEASVAPDELARQLEAANKEAAQAAARHAEAESEVVALAAELSRLREAAQVAEQTKRERNELTTVHVTAKRDIEMFSAELARAGSNGYDPSAHARLSAELAQATEASQRCAALRETAASLQLSSARLIEQTEKLNDAKAVAERLADDLATVAVDPEAIPSATADCERLDSAVDLAGAALRDAQIKATSESHAVEAARDRLKAAHGAQAKLAEERREELVRVAVQKALGEFRADASRRARPALIAEASQLLGTVTKGRYDAIRISDKYVVEVFDGPSAFPLKRFSGGEQDLAGLCVRLGLSRMAARQRGIEAGFTILDEVFGSQDEMRRRMIAEQLRSLLDAEFDQIFVISHTDDVREHCDLAIFVTRGEDGISRAEGPR